MNLLLAVVAAAVAGQSPQPAAPEATIAIQVALDRSGFSPGVIDGRMGANTKRALEAYRRHRGGEPELAGGYLTVYTISEDDVSTPFVERITGDMMAQAQLPSLGYQSIVELLAERYHTTPDLLHALNPEATFASGEEIRVPNVEPFIAPAPRLAALAPGAKTATRKEKGTSGRGTPAAPSNAPVDKPDVVIRVSEASSALLVLDAGNNVILYAPVTTGSEHDPLPIGEWTVTGVQFSPEFRYNPDLFWDADPAHAKAVLKPGPNNPVGVVWIDLSKEHYGIHGTPEPSTVGTTASHGCVRLTNWDALSVAGLVKPGTRVIFTR